MGNARQRARGRQLASADTTAHPPEPQRCQTGPERGRELLSGGSGSPLGDTSNYRSGSSEKFSQLNPYRCISDFFFFNYIATCQSKCVWSVLYSPPSAEQWPFAVQASVESWGTAPSTTAPRPCAQARSLPKANYSCWLMLYVGKELIFLCFRLHVIWNPKYRFKAQARFLLEFVGPEFGLGKPCTSSPWMLWNVSWRKCCCNDALGCWHFHPWNFFLSTEICHNYVYSFHYPVILFSDLKHPTACTCLTSSCEQCWQAPCTEGSPILCRAVCYFSAAEHDHTDTWIVSFKDEKSSFFRSFLLNA